jgi:HK97 family phage prohead protease
MEYKALDNAFKDVDPKKGIVTGHLAAFNNVDSYGDILMPESLFKTIKENGPSGKNRIKYVYQHDLTMPIGKFNVLEVDEKGLYYEAQMSKAPSVQDKLIMIEEGILTENSIGYQTSKSDTNDNGPRELKEIRRWEGSLVTVAANDLAIITGIKSMAQADKIAAVCLRMQKISNFLRKAKMADETTYQKMADELEAMKSILKEIQTTTATELAKMREELDEKTKQPIDEVTEKDADEELAAAILEALNS